MNREKWQELADLYAAGALDGAERSAFENFLSSGGNEAEQCRAYLAETEELLTSFPKALQPLKPSPAVKDRVMAGLTEPALAAGSSFNWAWAAAGVWALTSVIVVLSWNLTQTKKEMADLQLTIASPTAKIVDMKGMDTSAQAMGRVIMDPAKKKCIFMTSGLSALPEGKIYQLWGLVGEQPVSAAVFKVSETGCATLDLSKISGVERFDKFAVTIEPDGGVPQPTGAMHLLGAV